MNETHTANMPASGFVQPAAAPAPTRVYAPRSSEEVDKLIAALIAAQKSMTIVPKGGMNTFDRYKYSTIGDMVTVVHNSVFEHGLVPTYNVREVIEQADRQTSSGKTERAVRVILDCRLLHSSGQWYEITAWGEGQDRGDKAIYKAVTGARKYALQMMFDLASGDDPEVDSPQGQTVSEGSSHGQPEQPRPPATRPTAEKPKRGRRTNREAAIDKAKEWAGNDDAPTAIRGVMFEQNIAEPEQGSELTPDQWKTIGTFITEQMAKGVTWESFAEYIQGASMETATNEPPASE